MKQNIKTVSYSSNFKIEDKNSEWHTWDEYCDLCGKQIMKFGHHGVLSPKEIDNIDFCLDCMRNRTDEVKTILRK